MRIELVLTEPQDFKIGDEWHGDFVSPSAQNFVHAPDGMIWCVINTPIDSTNQQLFWDSIDAKCVVVPVKYMDGARGSRLFDPSDKIVIRRDLDQK